MHKISALKCENLIRARKLFVENGILPSEGIRSSIASSWQRSRGIDPEQSYKQLLTQNKLEIRQGQNSRLLTIARPIMEDIGNMADMNFLRLYDYEGYTLDGYTNLSVPFDLGFNCSEQSIGTNAIGIALIENAPQEISGFEHYANWLLSFSCKAAPIHDTAGQILGILNISNPYGDLPDWISKVMNLGIDLIENQFRYKSVQSENKYIRSTFSSIIEMLNEGLLVIDQQGNITEINQKSLEMLGINDRQALIGKNISAYWHHKDRELAKLFPNAGKSKSIWFIKGENKTVIECNPLVTSGITAEECGRKVMLLSNALPKNSFKAKRESHHSDNYRFSLDRLTVINQVWVDIKETMRNATRYGSNVLIEGETGTGKELLARIIHFESRRNGEFVPINCGSIPKELIHSELFGYDEGAFTGAKKGGQIGKFEMADEGTIFLDEIGEMPQDMQVNLLRFLQDKIITRVGSNKSKKIQAQIIAATNRELCNEIKNGNFRDDLFYRLNVVNIKIPPLRERKDDIPVIAAALLRDLCYQLNIDLKISPPAMDIMCQYEWPGNVRELGNIVERAVINCKTQTIMPVDLPKFILNQAEVDTTPNRLVELKEHEKEIIIITLQNCYGNVTKAARSLGMSRVTLYRKMNKFNITCSR